MRRRLLAVALALALAGPALIAGGWLWLDQPVHAEPSFRLPPVDRLVVEKAQRRMLAYSGGELVHTFEGIQLGDAPEGPKRFEGDERTPEGTYTIDYRNPRSSYHLALHISYPNAADTDQARAHGRSPGGLIMIHGQPNWLPGGRIEGDWTDGCIALSNDEIEALWLAVADGTPIEIRR